MCPTVLFLRHPIYGYPCYLFSQFVNITTNIALKSNQNILTVKSSLLTHNDHNNYLASRSRSISKTLYVIFQCTVSRILFYQNLNALFRLCCNTKSVMATHIGANNNSNTFGARNWDGSLPTQNFLIAYF